MKTRCTICTCLLMVALRSEIWAQDRVDLSSKRTAANAALLSELNRVTIPEFDVEDVTLKEAMDKLMNLLPKDIKYIKGFKVDSEIQTYPVTLDLRNVNFSDALSAIAACSSTEIEDVDGMIHFTWISLDVTFRTLPVKPITARKLGFTSIGEKDGFIDIGQLVKRFGVRPGGPVEYYPRRDVIHIEANLREIHLLESIITLVDRGMTISPPDK